MGLHFLHRRTILSSFHDAPGSLLPGTCERAVSHSLQGATPFFDMGSRLAGAG